MRKNRKRVFGEEGEKKMKNNKGKQYSLDMAIVLWVVTAIAIIAMIMRRI